MEYIYIYVYKYISDSHSRIFTCGSMTADQRKTFNHLKLYIYIVVSRKILQFINTIVELTKLPSEVQFYFNGVFTDEF